MKTMSIGHEPGWSGVLSRDEQPEAKFKNGTRVRKMLHEAGDRTPLDTSGTILGSLYAPEVGVGYFVEWDDKPRTSVFVVEEKLGV